MIDRVKEREAIANEQNQKKASDVDELFEKKKKKEAELAKLDEELEALQKENADFPAQFRQIEDHSTRTEQELRRRLLELQEKENELNEIQRKA